MKPIKRMILITILALTGFLYKNDAKAAASTKERLIYQKIKPSDVFPDDLKTCVVNDDFGALGGNRSVVKLQCGDREYVWHEL